MSCVPIGYCYLQFLRVDRWWIKRHEKFVKLTMDFDLRPLSVKLIFARHNLLEMKFSSQPIEISKKPHKPL